MRSKASFFDPNGVGDLSPGSRQRTLGQRTLKWFADPEGVKSLGGAYRWPSGTVIGMLAGFYCEQSRAGSYGLTRLW
jgi:hypothetical protein